MPTGRTHRQRPDRRTAHDRHDPTATNYADLSVLRQHDVHLRRRRRRPVWTSKSPAKSAKTPSVGYGPTASGWGGNLSPTNLDWPAGPVKTALGSTLTDFRYVFNRIGTTNIDKTDILHVKPCADLTLTNHGGRGHRSLDLHERALRARLLRARGGARRHRHSFPYSLGAAVPRSRSRCDSTTAGSLRRTAARTLPVKGVQYGLLTINSNDSGSHRDHAARSPAPGRPPRVARTSCRWPASSTRPWDHHAPDRRQGRPGRLQGHQLRQRSGRGHGLRGAVAVLERHRRHVSSVRQIVATHSPGRARTARLVPAGQPRLGVHVHVAGRDRLPDAAPRRSNGPRSEGSFSPAPVRSGSGSTREHGRLERRHHEHRDHGERLQARLPETGPCGHHVRFFPLETATGDWCPTPS